MYKLLSFITLVFCTISRAYLSDSICQLTDCRSEQFFPQCFKNFSARLMLPMKQRKHMITKRGTHLFDLFYDSNKLACTFLMVDLVVTGEQLEVQLLVNCKNLTELVTFNYVEKSFLSKTCFEKNLGIPLVAQKCNYFYREQLRITIITNDTVLIEDLSSEVSPGTRMFFRTSSSKSIFTGPRCSCKNLYYGQIRYIDCVEMYQRLVYGGGNTLVSFKISMVAWVTFSVFFAVGSIAIFGWFWISKQIKRKTQVVNSTCTI